MYILMNPLFWLMIFLSYLLLQLKLPFSPSQKFGFLNALILILLFNIYIVLVLLLIVFTLWGVLFIARYLHKQSYFPESAAVIWILIVVVTLMFLLNKVGLEKKYIFSLLLEKQKWLKTDIFFKSMTLLSFSYLFLRILDITSTSGIGKLELLDPISLIGYLAPFHMLPAGPICSYKYFLEINRSPLPEPTFKHLLLSVDMITTGLLFKFVFAECIKISLAGLNGKISPPVDIIGSAILLVYIYFDFAGYSRVALGVGRLLNVPTPPNFDSPFLATSVTGFWQRWHMSLTSFVQRNIFNALQLKLVRYFGLKWSSLVLLVTLTISFSFVGLWHKISPTFLLWGISMGLIMYLEKIIRDYCLRFSWSRSKSFGLFLKIVGPFYTLTLISTLLLLVMAEIF